MNSKQRTYGPRPIFFWALVLYAVFMKLMPYVLMQFGMSIDPETTIYPWNFSPIAALCLFGAAFFRDVRWSFAVPLLAWLAGDIGILLLVSAQRGLDAGTAMAVYPDQLFVYTSFALIVGMGLLLRRSRRPAAVFGAGVAGSVAFFLLTNFGVWLLGGRYAQTPAGLIECYMLALPFFRNFLVSTLAFSAALFSPLGVKVLEQAEEGASWVPAGAPVATRA